jgi:hypothetical protein
MNWKAGSRRLLIAVSGALLATCSGNNGSSPALPGTSPMPLGVAAKNRATFVVTVPRPTPTPGSLGAKRPAYISPATQSMTVTITQGSTTVIQQSLGLTVTSPNCSSSLASVVCTFTLALNAGSYIATLTTFDGSNGTGNALSTGQDIPFTVVADQNNIVPLTLSGIPRHILVTADGPLAVYVVAQDADGNFIVGIGAPVYAAAKTSGDTVVSVAQPQVGSPNIVSLTAVTPPVVGSETIGVSLSYPAGLTNACTQPSAVCSLSNAVTATYAPAVAFLNNFGTPSILGYTVPLGSSTQAPTVDIMLPAADSLNAGMAMSSSGTLFAWSYLSSGAMVIDPPPYTNPQMIDNSQLGLSVADYPGAVAPNGDLLVPQDKSPNGGAIVVIPPPYTAPSTFVTTGIALPYGAATDANNNLYVANNGTPTVTVYAPPFTAGPSATLQTTNYPFSLLVANGQLIVGEYDAIDVFDLPVTSSSTPVATLKAYNAIAPLAEDATGNLWAVCLESCAKSARGEVDEYTAPFVNGEASAVALKMPAAPFHGYDPTGIAFDGAGDLFVTNSVGGSPGHGDLLEYSGAISSSSTPAYGIENSLMSFPSGLVVTPGGGLTITP